MDIEMLYRLGEMNKVIEHKMTELDELRAIAGGSAIQYKRDTIQTSGDQDRLEAIVVRIVDLENEVDGLVDRYVSYKSNLMRQINRLKHERSRDVLYHRYILFQRYTEISHDLDLNERWIKRVHQRALKEFEKLK